MQFQKIYILPSQKRLEFPGQGGGGQAWGRKCLATNVHVSNVVIDSTEDILILQMSQTINIVVKVINNNNFRALKIRITGSACHTLNTGGNCG